jgi:hypothetical protein
MSGRDRTSVVRDKSMEKGEWMGIIEKKKGKQNTFWKSKG